MRRGHLQLGPQCVRRARGWMRVGLLAGTVWMAAVPGGPSLVHPSHAAASSVDASVLAERSAVLEAGASAGRPRLSYLVEQVDDSGDWSGRKPQVVRRTHVLSAVGDGRALWREVRVRTFKRYTGTGITAGPPAGLAAALESLAGRSSRPQGSDTVRARLGRDVLAPVSGPVAQDALTVENWDLAPSAPAGGRTPERRRRSGRTVTRWRNTNGTITTYEETADDDLTFASAVLAYAVVGPNQVVAVEETYDCRPSPAPASPARSAAPPTVLRTVFTVYSSGGVLEEKVGPGGEITYHKPLSSLVSADAAGTGAIVQVCAPSEASVGSALGGSVRMPWCYHLVVSEVQLDGPSGQRHRIPLCDLRCERPKQGAAEAVFAFGVEPGVLREPGRWQVSPVAMGGAVLPGASVAVHPTLRQEALTIEQSPAIVVEHAPLARLPKILAVGGTYRLSGTGMLDPGDGSSAAWPPMLLVGAGEEYRSLPLEAYSDLQAIVRIPADLPVDGTGGAALFCGRSALSAFASVDFVKVSLTRPKDPVKVGVPFALEVSVSGLGTPGRHVATLSLDGCLRTAQGLRATAEVELVDGRGSVSVVAVRAGSFSVSVSSVASAEATP